jgi:galacturan 1,4-alpha-galacturonidase
MNASNCWFDDIYVNNTAQNAPYGANWVQNTDGFDTMDAYNIVLTDFTYQGELMTVLLHRKPRPQSKG